MRLRTVSLCWILSVLVLSAPVMAEENVGTEFIPPHSAVAILAKPQAIYGSPLLQMVPWEVLNVKTEEIAGLPIQAIDSVLAIASPPGVNGKPSLGIVVKLNHGITPEKLLAPIQERWPFTEATWPGTQQKYLQGSPELMFDIYPVDDNTYLLAMPETLKAMLAQKEQPQTSPLATLVQTSSEQGEVQAFLIMEPLRDMLEFLVADPNLQKFPGLKELPSHLQSAHLIGNLDMEKGGLTLKLTTESPAQAEQLQKIVSKLLDLGVERAIQMGQPPKTNEVEENAFRQYVTRICNTLRAAIEPEVEGNQVILTTVGKPGTSPQVMVASGTAVLVPLIASAQQQAFRSGSVNNMKQIILAMHNYHETYGHMPANSYDKEGKPLLSWRVHLLPFVEQAALYDQFHLDEPWDSEHNRKLAEMIPDPYLSPSSKNELGPQAKTRYLKPLGEGFPASAKKNLRFQDLTDGASNTIAIVEVPPSDAVLWTRPDDFHPNMDSLLESFTPGETAGIIAALYDGSVHSMLKKDLTDQILKVLLTHQGGEPNKYY
ncbi:DUF1559 domain-containing protein [Bremerella cremea]|uniref:DUF1559 domain-containing protein n=1 Tax=Bremerella cremea TaxID=1031537 RepID=A0A368KUZ5_9BACT|nr:DUF1559 domain-containing protein [Bremerella cremea]RCS54151.1 DUF1559 domain-containing protein [Bremerella cremea]